MTINQLLKQFEKDMVWENGTYRHEPHITIYWLRTNIEAMCREAVGEEKQDKFYSPGEVEVNNSIVRNILRASILQKLGISK